MHYSWHKIETNYTDILSEFTEKTRFEDIPPEVVERAKMIMLQTIGVSLAAKDVPGTKKAAEMALAANGGAGGTATGWVSGDRLAPANAAFLAGALSDMLDWEDTSWTGHPACGIVPCAWVEAEHLKKSGKDLLTAIVLGYEVYQRIACAVQPTLDFQQEHGWGLTSWQIFGCIIPAVKLMGLDANAINKAIGLGTACSTLPTCLHEFTMSDFYHYEHGLRARDGIVIADLVQKGVHNFMDGLDDPAAYANLMTDHYDPSWYTRELGETWLTMTTLLKHWPANMWVQTPAELASEIIFGNGLRKEDIREIIVDPPRMSRMDLPPEGGFKSLTHAQFSIPYVISAMLHDPTPGANWYSREMLSNPDVIAFAKRVVPGNSPPDPRGLGFKLFREGSFLMKTMTVNTFDGRSFTKSMDCHPGHPANMMTREQFVDRFRIQAAPVLGGEKLERAIDALCSIETCEDISTLSGFLHGDGGRTI